MKRTVFAFVALAATSLWSVANATTVTYNFSGTTQSIGNTGTVESGAAGGMVFTSSPDGFNNGGTAPTLTIYGETAPAGLTGNPGDDGGPSAFGSTTGLFEVTNNGTNTATGIAPYISSQASGNPGSLNLTLENGITESDVLLLNLSNFAAGSTVKFTMATGAQAAANTGINLWTGTPTGTPLGFGTGWGGQTASNSLTSETITGGNVNGTGGAATKTFDNGGAGYSLAANEWIAIQADCHYLVLQSISITSPSGVPEPSFYGFIALGMIGLVIGTRKFRTRTAEEKA